MTHRPNANLSRCSRVRKRIKSTATRHKGTARPMDLSSVYVDYGLWIIFGAVLLQQLGVPIPVFPLLIFAGAQAVERPVHGVWALVLSVLASAIGNYVWFLAGRRYGHRVLKAVCKMSLSPDSCVRQTETTFERYGVATLLVARFLPGLGMVAPPLAGGLGLRATTFLLYNGAGSALWAAGGLALGLVFHTEVEWLLESLGGLGSHAIGTVAGIVAIYVAYRWWNRWRFRRALCAARISVAELDEMMNQGIEPLVLDVRSRTQRKLDGRSIPGARLVDLDDVERSLTEIPRDRDIIVYCACPNEATAAKIAMQLQKRGIPRVRPLAGGIDAWASAGLKLEVRETKP